MGLIYDLFCFSALVTDMLVGDWMGPGVGAWGCVFQVNASKDMMLLGVSRGVDACRGGAVTDDISPS